MEPETLVFNNCLVTVLTDNGYVQTTFDDNTFVPALPLLDPTNLFLAQTLGYKDDIKKMTMDHEILHTYLSETIGLDYSPTLWTLAHHSVGLSCVSQETQWIEDALVLSFQRYLNTKDVEPPLENYLFENTLILRRVRDNALRLIEDLGCKS